jgi:hypothetical protein
MNSILTATRQTTRPIIIPSFAATITELTKGVAKVKPPFAEGQGGLQSQTEPPVGYALEIYSLYHPLLLLTQSTGSTGEIAETEWTILTAMQLSRRGVLLWEGSASLTVIHTSEPATTFYAGGFNAQFQTPLIVKSPSELTINTTIIAAARQTVTPKAGTGFISTSPGPKVVPEAYSSILQEFNEAGSINYTLVAL